MRDTDRARQIMALALVRMESGRSKYGEFRPEADGRDLFEETEAELLDVINYSAMLIMQVRAIRHRLVTVLDLAEREPANKEKNHG